MKRVDFEKHLKKHGCKLKREGGNHSIWQNANSQAVSAVPRHRELDNKIVVQISIILKIKSPLNSCLTGFLG